METPRWLQFTSIGLGVATALTMRLTQLPLTYLQLVNRSPTRPAAAIENASIDAKTLETQSEQLLAPGDNVLTVMRKAMKEEGGLKVFLKGLLPALLGALVQGAVMPLVASLGGTLFERHNGTSRGALVLTTGVQFLVLQGILQAVVTPFDLLEIRLRLQHVSRTFKEECKYLWLRLGFTEWFSSAIVGPAMLSSAIYAASALVTQLVPVLVGAQTVATLQLEVVLSLAASFGFGLLAFPVNRARQLACATLRPLEQPVIPVAEYSGLGDELVRDEAWQGIGAAAQIQLLTMLPAPLLQLVYIWTQQA